MSKRKRKRERNGLRAAGLLVEALKRTGYVKPGAKVEVRVCGKRRKMREGGGRRV